MKIDKSVHKLLALWVRPQPKASFQRGASQVAEVVEATALFKPEHSFTKPYRGSLDWLEPKWELKGNAHITSQYARLTDDHPDQHGAIWNTQPLNMENWMVELNFRIHGKKKHGFGDGLTFWYTQEEPKENFRGLSIAIDTHNEQHRHGDSIISAMFHSGRPEFGVERVLGTIEARLRNLYYNPWIQIAYYRNILTLSVNKKGREDSDSADWVKCFSVGNLLLPKKFYLGCSATTSNHLSDHHDLIEIKTYELE